MALSNKDKALLLLLGINEAQLKGRGVATRAVNLGVAATLKAAKAGLPVARRAAAAAAPRVSQFAMANPYTTGALLGGAALASPPGQYLLEEAAASGRATRDQLDQDIEDIIELSQNPMVRAGARSKARSTYNKAVSRAMKAVKKSKYDGKPGTTRGKTTFGKVSKTVSKIMKGKKVPKNGVSGVIKRAVGKVRSVMPKKKPKRRTSGTTWKVTVN
jgi:hypothetical protein